VDLGEAPVGPWRDQPMSTSPTTVATAVPAPQQPVQADAMQQLCAAAKGNSEVQAPSEQTPIGSGPKDTPKLAAPTNPNQLVSILQ
jgi:hypothetical protein